jgi:2-haloacid dehalogenase
MATAQFGVRAAEILFVSSNGWDVAGAAAFGFETVWINRTGAPRERLPHGPAHTFADLRPLTELLA